MKKCNTIARVNSAVGLLFLLLPLSSIPAQMGSAHSDNLSGSQIKMFNAVSDELICQCGCNLVLSECGHVNCPSAIPMRKKIEEMILANKSEDDILKYFMTEYRYDGNPPKGRAILSQPGTKGFDLMAWVMPFILFGIFLVVIVFIVKRSTRTAGSAPVQPETANGGVAGMEQRIEDELRKLE